MNLRATRRNDWPPWRLVSTPNRVLRVRVLAGYLAAGGVRQIIVEMADAYLFVTAAGNNDCLAVITETAADMGLVGYEMAMLIKRMGAHLSAPRRMPLGGGEAI